MRDHSARKGEFWLIAQFRLGLTRGQFRKAILDITQGWKRRALWGTIGMQEIRKRYRRSVIGPFWLTISLGIMVGALGTLYGGLFNQPMDVYLPHMASGFIVWGFISSIVLDGTRAFIEAEDLIRQLSAPLSVHVYSVLWSNLVILAHNIWVYVFVALWFQKNPGWIAFLSIPAIGLVLLNGLWMGLLFGLLSARFRDIPQIIASLVQVIFFITPIIWQPEMLKGRTMILDWNPFYHLVEIVRGPLMGTPPSAENWGAVLIITVFGWGLALMFYTVYRWRLAYWV